MKEKIAELIDFFESEPNIILAFLFGSRITATQTESSDWDIGIYFKSEEYAEIESEQEYEEMEIWAQIIDILETDNVDLVVLNRAAPVVCYRVFTEGIPLIIKDKNLFLDLLCKISYEAIDWIEFAEDYHKILQKSHSITPIERARLIKYLSFLEGEYNEVEEIKKIGYGDYIKDSFKRKIIERWIENIVMAVLDIAKVFLASEKRQMPQTYKETLKIFGTIYFNEEFGKRLSWFAIMRNIIAHEYLDIKWKRIEKFVKEAEELIPPFIEKIKNLLK